MTNGEDGIVWASLNNDDNSKCQIWKLQFQPNNIHQGADTSQQLYMGGELNPDRTARAYKLGRGEFVIRYYGDVNDHTSPSKLLTEIEVETLRNYGINIVSVYQDWGDDPSYFQQDQEGITDATKALSLATAINQPEGSAIYFAVDCETKPTDKSNIETYFSEIKSVFDAADRKYKIGVYGSGYTCRIIKGKYAEYSWLSGAPGYYKSSEYDSPDLYNIRQAEQTFYNRKEFNDCVAVSNDYGQWFK